MQLIDRSHFNRWLASPASKLRHVERKSFRVVEVFQPGHYHLLGAVFEGEGRFRFGFCGLLAHQHSLEEEGLPVLAAHKDPHLLALSVAESVHANVEEERHRGLHAAVEVLRGLGAL